jgi:hypothetical protein
MRLKPDELSRDVISGAISKSALVAEAIVLHLSVDLKSFVSQYRNKDVAFG